VCRFGSLYLAWRPRGEAQNYGDFCDGQGHLKLPKWATALGGERLWAIEDCRHRPAGLKET
jgi:hypothetical protein